ncbi:MAG: elongation factor Ts [Acidimicrobiia bacterium]|nr:elongation factor Ts [Acidimicrobiia bacterium]
MADFTAKEVQQLRQQAGVGMMDAKKALNESGGDIEAAFELLRERGLAAAAKRADREASEGAIGSYLHIQDDRPISGVIVELSSETDFVAKTPEFLEAAKDIAMHIAWGKPSWTTREEVPEELLAKEAELISKQAENEGKPEHIIPKIVEGRLESFFKDHVLLDQTFANTAKFEGSIGEMVAQLAARMGENISIRRFARLTIGEE